MRNRTAKFARKIVLASLCLVALSAMASVASACPSCQAALNSDTNAGDLPRGIYYSILFMMSMPFAIVGTFGAFAYRAVKREQRRLADSKQAEPKQAQS